MNSLFQVAAMVTLLIITGCQPHPLDIPVRSSSKRLGDRASSSTAFTQPRREHTDQQDTVPRPVGKITLPKALALAIRHNPHIGAYSMNVRMAEARLIQAGLWPNPELYVEVENVAGSGRFSGADAAETTLSLAQTISLGGDIERRGDLVDLQMQLADWEYQSARLAVLLEVRRRCIDAMAADRSILMAEQELKLAQDTERITTQRVEAGDASPVEKTRVIVPVIRAQVALKRARREREAAYRLLTATWGGRDVTFDQVSGDLEAIDTPPTAKQLVRLINQNPVVARWATEISERIAQRRLAEAQSVPDLTGRVGVKHDNQDDDVSLVLGVSLPLPLFDRRQGDILAARIGESEARFRQRNAELRIEGMLSTAYAKLAGAHDEAAALRDKAMPAATRAHEATQQAFNEGKLPFLDVLDAQRTLFELQRDYVKALVNYHTAAAEIESLIGQPLSKLEPFVDQTQSHSYPQTESQP